MPHIKEEKRLLLEMDSRVYPIPGFCWNWIPGFIQFQGFAGIGFQGLCNPGFCWNLIPGFWCLAHCRADPLPFAYP